MSKDLLEVRNELQRPCGRSRPGISWNSKPFSVTGAAGTTGRVVRDEERKLKG